MDLQHRTDGRDREALVRRYRELVMHELPARAVSERWVVRADHCFGRIVLDHVVGSCWYAVLDRRRSPAFLQLDDHQLRVAVGLADRILTEGDPLLSDLNDQSLQWRRPSPAATRSA